MTHDDCLVSDPSFSGGEIRDALYRGRSLYIKHDLGSDRRPMFYLYDRSFDDFAEWVLASLPNRGEQKRDREKEKVDG